MCDRCGEPGLGAHAASISERPAHRLVGLMWEGSFADAEAGALRPLLARAKTLSDAETGLWKSPIVALSWNDRADGFRHFVGIATDNEISGELVSIDIPEMRLASAWHAAEDGDVVGHYGALVGWMRENGLAHNRAVFDQREEYPPDVDLAGPPSLRLMLPVE